jgi:integrase/recombinase XerD
MTLADHGAAWLAHLAATNYAPATRDNRRSHLTLFTRWLQLRGITQPAALTLPILEAYQRALSQPRADGTRLTWGTQAQRLVTVQRFLAWCVRTHVLTASPAAGLVLPRRPQTLPRSVLTAAEVEVVLALPDCSDPLGLRDRALMETLYSTGLRRTECARLTLQDLDPERGVVFVRQGKGRKDRVVPIGQRALDWIERYTTEARPQLVVPPETHLIFLTARGRPIRPSRLSEHVHGYLARSGLGKPGSCHVFRHTMATLLLEGGADVRYVQAILGHASLAMTARYTHVAIKELKAVHARTHPAERDHAGASSPLAAVLRKNT